jgi:uncharacterized protein YggE
MKHAHRPAFNLLLGLGVGLVLSGIPSTARAQIIETPRKKVIPNLTVRGSAELMKPADQLRVTIGVISESADAREALGDNSKRMREVVGAIEGVGLKEDEYETGRFQIRPIYSRPPRNPPPQWRAQITGYEVTNTVMVRTKQLALAGDLIEAANKAGANTIDSIGFDLADERKFRAEAISEATAHALADARKLAESAGVKLVRLLFIDLDSAGEQLPVSWSYAAGAGMALREAAVPPPITPRDVTVTASVTVVYEIAPR